MTTAEILAWTAAKGIRVTLFLDDLAISCDDEAKAAPIVAKLRARRGELVAHLKAERWTVPGGYVCGICSPDAVPKSVKEAKSSAVYRWCGKHGGSPFYLKDGVS